MVEDRHCGYFCQDEAREQGRLISEHGFLLEKRITITDVWRQKAMGRRISCDF